MPSVPFKQTAHGGFAEVTGLLRFEDSTLFADFEICDAITGLLKSCVKLEIPINQIDGIDYRGGFFGGKIRILVQDMDLIREMSWRNGAEFEVKVKRRDREAAAHFAEELEWTRD